MLTEQVGIALKLLLLQESTTLRRSPISLATNNAECFIHGRNFMLDIAPYLLRNLLGLLVEAQQRIALLVSIRIFVEALQRIVNFARVTGAKGMKLIQEAPNIS